MSTQMSSGNSNLASVAQLTARPSRWWQQLASGRSDPRGSERVVTRNSEYRLRDGICVQATRIQPRRRADPSQVVGMKRVGWLSPGGDGGTLAERWCKGARAVFWCPAADGRPAQLAVTSPAVLVAHDTDR